MDADRQVKLYREAMGAEGLVRAWAREGRNAEGTCGGCGATYKRNHKTTCAHHPRNRQRAVR